MVLPRLPVALSTRASSSASRSSLSRWTSHAAICSVVAPWKTQFTNAEAALGAYRWPEYAAGHRARCVQIATACLRIKYRTRFVVGIVFEIIAAFGEYSRGRVTWKAGPQTADRGTSTPAHPLRPLGIMLFQFGQTFLQPKARETGMGSR